MNATTTTTSRPSHYANGRQEKREWGGGQQYFAAHLPLHFHLLKKKRLKTLPLKCFNNVITIFKLRRNLYHWRHCRLNIQNPLSSVFSPNCIKYMHLRFSSSINFLPRKLETKVTLIRSDGSARTLQVSVICIIN